MIDTDDLSKVPTCALNAELIKREGVSSLFLGPDDEIKKVGRGPAWIVVNRD
jgi:hypothetical protein